MSASEISGILATIIPVFFLTIFLAEGGQLVSTGWVGTVVGWICIVLMAVAEWAALGKLINPAAPDWYMTLAYSGAMIGLAVVTALAGISMLPPYVLHRVTRRGVEQLTERERRATPERIEPPPATPPDEDQPPSP